MKYFYLSADGTTAGPETLETLAGMLGGGVITLGTLVVPAGGEDWTPLARVLRFFYADEAGATAGPVPFSEINRLHQIAALPAEAWIMEEGGTEWKSVAAVLTDAGVPVLAPPAPAAPAIHRSATGAWRPPATVRAGTGHIAGPYEPPGAHHGRTLVIKYRATGGIGRLQFIGYYILLIVLVTGALAAYIYHNTSIRGATLEDFESFRRSFLAVNLVSQAVLFFGSCLLISLRIKNIGWPWPFLFIALLPAILVIVALFFPITGGWLIMVAGLAAIVSAIFQCALIILPPAYARHRRFDTAARILTGIIVLIIVAGITWSMLTSGGKDKNSPAQRTSPGLIFLSAARCGC